MAKHADSTGGKMTRHNESKSSPTLLEDAATVSAVSADQAVGRAQVSADPDRLASHDPDRKPDARERAKHSNALGKARKADGLVNSRSHTDLDNQSSPPDEEGGRADTADIDDHADQSAKNSVAKLFSKVRSAIAISAAIVVALAALTGWLGYRTYNTRQVQAERNQWIAVARQGALNLTTIDYTKVDADLQRILDSATGPFRDDFEKRAQPFAEVVKKAQSRSQCTITEAGLESQNGDHAQVLVAVSVKTSNIGAQEQEPRRWRMRIGLQRVGDVAKVSSVEFVP